MNGVIAMNTLKENQNVSQYGLLPTFLVIAGLLGISTPAHAICFGYPESTAGCKINGVAGACIGTSATGDIITSYSCTNPVGSPLEGTNTCVVRGLGGNDVISANSNNTSYMSIFCGGGGNDIIQGGYPNDVMFGEAGLDTLIGGGGTNLLYGGPDNDTLLLGYNYYYYGSFAFGQGGTRDVCQSGSGTSQGCEVKLP